MRTLALVLLVLSFALGFCNSCSANYVLYFIDTSHNVCRIDLDNTGHPSGKAVRLTERGGYDAFSISPSAKRLVGYTSVRQSKEPDNDLEWVTANSFIEGEGLKRRLLAQVTGMAPFTGKSDFINDRYYIRYDGDFDYDVSICSAETGKPLISQVGSPPVLSSDGRFALLMIDSTRYALFDLSNGKVSRMSGDVPYFVWIADTHKAAWMDGWGGAIMSAEITAGDMGPVMAGKHKIADGPYGDIQYIAGKGLCLTDEAQTVYTTDLKTFTKGPVPPAWKPEQSAYQKMESVAGAWAHYAEYTPDRKFVACPFGKDTTKVPEIRIYDDKGNSWVVAEGTQPTWKGIKAFD